MEERWCGMKKNDWILAAAIFFVAVLIHTFIDIMVGLYQFRIIKELIILEVLMFIFSITAFLIVYKKIYKKN